MITDDFIPDRWFDKGSALRILLFYLSRGRETIRIATGFFTVYGYSLIRKTARGKNMFILVGIEEPGEKRVVKALIQEILLHLRTGIGEDRRQAVQELVKKMERGEFHIIDARATDHHAKLYIIDEDVVLVASANVSGRGLIEAIEAGTVEKSAEAVTYFLHRYDDYFAHGIDITQPLLDALRLWLGFALPWNIYLKTLMALKDLEDTRLQQQRSSYRKPVGFQKNVIARALRQINEFRGAMIVASTGLGKTVIGTDVALRLHESGEIHNILVIGPKAVEREWRNHLRSAGLPFEYFIHSVLDVTDPARNGRVSDLEVILKHMDASWLIIIDESHQLRNRYHTKIVNRRLQTIERLAYQRLCEAIARSGCNVLLLTGTPYSTDIENVNNQLYLLPHTGPESNQPILEEYINGASAWSVSELQDVRELPVGSVITTPYVAKYYGAADAAGNIALDFNGTSRYIPRVLLYRIDVPLFLEREVAGVLDSGCFTVHVPDWQPRNPKWRPFALRRRASIETKVRVAWGSSPWALGDILRKVYVKEYKVAFEMPAIEQQQKLRPLKDHIEQMTFRDDAKVLGFCQELDKHHQLGRKVIVFSEQLATVVYLETALAELRPQLSVACTVRMQRRGSYQMKNEQEIHRILTAFAPVAQQQEQVQATYDILITTDAFGVGVNLQDAQVVVSYDLAWTPIEPAQRAGRILRFWALPRTVAIYVLKPTFLAAETSEIIYQRRSLGIVRRWDTLTLRHGETMPLLDLPTLPIHSHEEIDMPALTSPSVIIEELHLDDLRDEDLGVSSIFRHTAVLEQYRQVAKSIPDDIVSAMEYEGEYPLLYILLRYNEKYYWPVYDLKRKRLLTWPDITLLNRIECQYDTPPMGIDPNLVEKWGDLCIRTWCNEHHYKTEQVIRICTLYLHPSGKTVSFEGWMERYLEQA